MSMSERDARGPEEHDQHEKALLKRGRALTADATAGSKPPGRSSGTIPSLRHFAVSDDDDDGQTGARNHQQGDRDERQRPPVGDLAPRHRRLARSSGSDALEEPLCTRRWREGISSENPAHHYGVKTYPGGGGSRAGKARTVRGRRRARAFLAKGRFTGTAVRRGRARQQIDVPRPEAAMTSCGWHR